MESQTQAGQGEERLLVKVSELTAKVRELQSEVERTHRLATLGLLAGSIAHEFNNILTPVLSYAHMALASPEDEAMTRKALRKAADGTEKAARIASAMLGFVREEDQPERAEVRAVVEEAMRCLGRDPAGDGIMVDVDVPAGCAVRMRPIALEQVLMNLILNAVEAMRPGSGRLRIAAKCSTWNTPGPPGPPGRSGVAGVTIEVEDTGPGIAPEMIERIFQPFVSHRPAAGTGGEGKRKGTGLGLAICKRLIEEAGGTIGVSSRVGEGTTFRIGLPGA